MEPTDRERALARSMANTVMLEQLWIHVLANEREPLEEARAAEAEARSVLEERLSLASGRDAVVTQHLSAELFDGMWRAITAELASHEEPIPFVPAPRDQSRPERDGEGGPPDGSEQAPGR